jgi:hypothetical protein
MKPRRVLLAASAAVALAIAISPARADELCQDHPREQWMQPEAIRAKAEALGYSIRKIGEEDGCWEVKGTKDGQRVEAYFDPVSGEIVKTKGES